MSTENKPVYFHEIVLLDFDEISRTMGATGKGVIIDQEKIVDDFLRRFTVTAVTDKPDLSKLSREEAVSIAFLQNLEKTIFYASYFRWAKEEGKLYAKIAPAFDHQAQDILDLLKTGVAKLIPRLIVQSGQDTVKLNYVACVDISIVDLSLASVSLGQRKVELDWKPGTVPPTHSN